MRSFLDWSHQASCQIVKHTARILVTTREARLSTTINIYKRQMNFTTHSKVLVGRVPKPAHKHEHFSCNMSITLKEYAEYDIHPRNLAVISKTIKVCGTKTTDMKLLITLKGKMKRALELDSLIKESSTCQSSIQNVNPFLMATSL